MSLVITTYVPEGVVMASDSRQSITLNGKQPDGKEFNVETVNSDNVTKTFLLELHNVGISVFGQDLLGGIPTAHHIKRFQDEKLSPEDNVETIAKKLRLFFRDEFGTPDTGFHICGYKKEEKTSTPHIYYVHIGRNELQRRNLKPDKTIAYGATWSGQADVLTNLLNPVIIEQNGQSQIIRQPAPVIWDAMALQDAVDFSIYAIRTTIDTMRFQARPKNVGGAIDVLALTSEGGNWISKRTITAD